MLRRFFCWLGFHSWYSGEHGTDWYFNDDDTLNCYQVFLYCECCLKTKVATVTAYRPQYSNNLVVLKTEKDNENNE